MRDRTGFWSSWVLFSWILLFCTFALGLQAQTTGMESDTGTQPGQTVKAKPTRSLGDDWPGFLGPDRDGKSREKGIATDWSEGLPILWTHEIGEGYSAPSVAAGRVFVFDRHGDLDRLTALNSETGKEQWRVEFETDYVDSYGYSNGPRASAVIDDDRVYTYGAKGKLRCFQVVDGELLWEVDTSQRFGVVQNFFGVGSTPAIEGDLLIAQVGGSPPGSPGIQSGEVQPNGSAVVAFDKITGKVVWQSGDDLAAYAAIQLATIHGRRWVLSFGRSGLLGLDPQSGTHLAQFPWRAKVLESVNASTPMVVKDRIMITETYGPGSSLLEVQPQGFEAVWKSPKDRELGLACHWNTPIYQDGIVYGSSGRNSNGAELMAVDFESGEVLWREPGLQRASLLSADGHFVVLSEDGTLRLIRHDREKYNLVSELRLEEGGKSLLGVPAWNAPVLSHGILYIRGSRRLVALDLIQASPVD